jgi:hypothetical protein
MDERTRMMKQKWAERANANNETKMGRTSERE